MVQATCEDVGALVRGDDDAEAWLGHRRILQRKIILHSPFFLHNSIVHTLYIDLASNKGSLALVTEQEVLAIEHIDHRMGDQELLPRLEQLLGAGGPPAGRASWAWGDIQRIACVVGPGGFMSLRVAVALANTLADQLQIPIAGVHLSEVYKARTQNALWLHSTKKQELFVREFGDNAKIWPEATHVTLEDLITTIRTWPAKPLFWVGELIPEHQKALAVSVAEIRESPLRRPEDVFPKFVKSLSYQKQILEPWYGRGW